MKTTAAVIVSVVEKNVKNVVFAFVTGRPTNTTQHTPMRSSRPRHSPNPSSSTPSPRAPPQLHLPRRHTHGTHPHPARRATGAPPPGVPSVGVAGVAASAYGGRKEAHGRVPRENIGRRGQHHHQHAIRHGLRGGARQAAALSLRARAPSNERLQPHNHNGVCGSGG